MESVPLEYITERQCDLTKIGMNLDSKGYGKLKQFLTKIILNFII